MADDAKFRCEGCAREYRWKPELAGKRVKCKCGQVMSVSAEPPVAAEASLDDGLYELAEQAETAAKSGGGAAVAVGATCPGCQSALPAGAILCAGCGLNLKTGQRLSTAVASGASAAPKLKAGPTVARPGVPGAGRPGGAMLAYAGANRRTAADNANDVGGDTMNELVIPGALVVIGLVLQVMQYMHTGDAWTSFSTALPKIGLGLVFNLVLSAIGVGIIMRLAELSVGAPGPAVLKLAATCLLPTGIAALVASFVGGDSGFVQMMVPSILLFPLGVGCFMWLFNFDFDEAAYCVIAVGLVNLWLVNVLLAVVLGGSPTSITAPPAVVSADKVAARTLEQTNAKEAEAWVDADASRRFYDIPREQTVKLVKDLYAAGAEDVTLTTDNDYTADECVVTLPDDEDMRAKIFKIANDFEASREFGGPTHEDEGQTYLTFSF